MSSPLAASGSPGWFGKIPALGDFVVRRLPPSFVEPWDQWLSKELSEAHAQLGNDWPAFYRRAPIACFELGVGVLDEHAWCGILVPSFDRVGREFPLTIASNTARLPGREWWAALIAAGQGALTPGRGAKDLDDALAAIRDVEGAPARVADGQSVWWRWPDEPTNPLISDGLPCGMWSRIVDWPDL